MKFSKIYLAICVFAASTLYGVINRIETFERPDTHKKILVVEVDFCYDLTDQIAVLRGELWDHLRMRSILVLYEKGIGLGNLTDYITGATSKHYRPFSVESSPLVTYMRYLDSLVRLQAQQALYDNFPTLKESLAEVQTLVELKELVAKCQDYFNAVNKGVFERDVQELGQELDYAAKAARLCAIEQEDYDQAQNIGPELERQKVKELGSEIINALEIAYDYDGQEDELDTSTMKLEFTRGHNAHEFKKLEHLDLPALQVALQELLKERVANDTKFLQKLRAAINKKYKQEIRAEINRCQSQLGQLCKMASNKSDDFKVLDYRKQLENIKRNYVPQSDFLMESVVLICEYVLARLESISNYNPADNILNALEDYLYLSVCQNICTGILTDNTSGVVICATKKYTQEIISILSLFDYSNKEVIRNPDTFSIRQICKTIGKQS